MKVWQSLMKSNQRKRKKPARAAKDCISAKHYLLQGFFTLIVLFSIWSLLVDNDDTVLEYVKLERNECWLGKRDGSWTSSKNVIKKKYIFDH